MTKVLIDAETLVKLHNLDAPLEVCDASGRTLGYFHPLAAPAASGGRSIRSPLSDEELQSRRQQRTGRPLAEILDRLGQA